MGNIGSRRIGDMMSERLVEINRRLEELDKLKDPIYDEQRKLEDEKEKIFMSIAKGIALGLSWELHYEKDSKWRKIYLESCDYDERDKANTRLFKEAEGDYHKTYDIIDDEVSLNMDDGSLYLYFSTVNSFKKYSTEWKLKVDMSKVIKEIDEVKNDLKILEELIGETR